ARATRRPAANGAIMKVGEVMTREVETMAPEASLQEAAQAMEAMGVGSLPVCAGRRLVGTITDRDIVVRGVATGRSPVDVMVRDCMTEDISWAYQDEDAEGGSGAHEDAAGAPAGGARPGKEPDRHRGAGRHRHLPARGGRQGGRPGDGGDLRAVATAQIGWGAPLQWRFFSFGPRASCALMIMSELEARGPEEHDAPLEQSTPARRSRRAWDRSRR